MGIVSRPSETVGASTGVPTGAYAEANQGYRFINWILDNTPVSSVFTITPASGTDGLYHSGNYTAVFEEIVYNVSYNAGNDDYNGSIPDTSLVTVNKNVTAAPGLELDGYVFTEWNTAKNGSGTGFIPDTAELDFFVLSDLADDADNVILYGQWTRMYNVTFDADGGSPEPSPTATTVPENATVAEPSPAPAKTGFVFNGWKADGSDELYNFSAAVTGDLNLKADYTENMTTITYASSNETMGAVDRSNETVGVVTGQPSGATAEAAYGYRFVSWTLNSAEVSSNATLIPEKDASSGLYTAADYIAGFAEMVYRVSYDANNADYNGSIPDGSLVTLNESVTAAPALELDDCVFTEWNTAEDGSGKSFAPDTAELNFSELSGLADENDIVTLYGQWSRLYNVTVENGTADKPRTVKGDTVNITANETAGYTFQKWNVTSGSITLENGSAAETSFTMPAENVIIEAVYAKNSFTIRADAGAKGTITPYGNVTVPDGGRMTFRMIPYIGWHINDVIVDNESVGPVSAYTFNAVDRNHTIYVTYEADPASTTAAPTAANVKTLIDHLVNGRPLDGNYDFDRNGVIDGRDLIILQQTMRF